MKKAVALFLSLLFTANIFAAKSGYDKNDLNVKLFKELEQQQGTKITIKQAVQMALKDSYQVYSATKNKEIYEEALRQAKSSYYPYIDLNASYNRALLRTQRLDEEAEKMVEATKVNNTYTAQLQANWVLWTGGKITNTKEFIRLQAESGDYQLKHAKSVVSKTVINFCYRIIYNSALVHVQETYLDVAKQHLNETKARYKQGLSSNLDIMT